MSKDRHIYVATAVIAVVMATAINALAPRNPLAGSVVPPQASVAADAQPQASGVFEAQALAPAAPQRVDASL